MTCRTLKHLFNREDDAFGDLKDNLLYAHPQVVEDDGRGLVWTGEASPTATAGPPPAVDQGRAPPRLHSPRQNSRYVFGSLSQPYRLIVTM
ncbi:MAG TPA: hypothetical protein VLK82_09380 [Candidatus Tectomicrobia bacterium]|nr:hypothetical protein [Candidatus Tectomicrobia bacterium]